MHVSRGFAGQPSAGLYSWGVSGGQPSLWSTRIYLFFTYSTLVDIITIASADLYGMSRKLSLAGRLMSYETAF